MTTRLPRHMTPFLTAALLSRASDYMVRAISTQPSIPMGVTLALLVTFALAPSLHAAGVYRCTDTNGRIEYRDTPCPGNESGGRVKIEPNVTPGIDPQAVQQASDAIAARAAARAADDEALRARAPVGTRASPTGYDTPWWMVPGPPPERATGQKSESDYTPAGGKR